MQICFPVIAFCITMSETKVDFQAKQPCRRHSKEEKKKQKREWKERRRLERKKSKEECRKLEKQEVNQKPSLANNKASPLKETDPQISVERETCSSVKRRKVTYDQTFSETQPPMIEKEGEEILVGGEDVREALKERNVSPPTTVNQTFPPEKKGPYAGTRDDNLAALSSRGKKCVALAKMKTSESSTQIPSTVPVSKYTAGLATARIKKAVVPLHKPEHNSNRTPWKPREMDRSLIMKISDEPIGSGTFGDCFLADYRGIKVVVKEMKRRDQSFKETERCKKEVIHEAKVLNSLGDHEGLPFLLGICVEKEPYSLVTQFHGSGEESLTLHKAIKSKVLNKVIISETFTRISTTLEYIHSKGYLHNDLKSNNVLLERRNDCFRPVIIDFGKSKPIEKERQSSKNSKLRAADYIAPEVRNGFKETTASDVYSLGKMLERAVFGRSFSNLFFKIISQTTNSSYLDRPSVLELIILLKNIA